MNGVLATLGSGVVAPAAISLFVAWVMQRSLGPVAKHFAAAFGFAAGYAAGCLLTRPWTELMPSRNFHWPLYLALGTAVLGPISAGGLFGGIRLLTYLLSGLAAAWLLVPDYDSLYPPRIVWVPLLAGYLFLLAASQVTLARRPAPTMTIGCWAAASGALAVLMVALFSLTLGKTAGIAAAALMGCWLAAWWKKDQPGTEGLGLCYAVIIGGWAFVAAIGSRPNLWALMAVPLAPLVLWLLAGGPLSRWPEKWQTLAVCLAVGAALGVCAVGAMLQLHYGAN